MMGKYKKIYKQAIAKMRGDSPSSLHNKNFEITLSFKGHFQKVGYNG